MRSFLISRRSILFALALTMVAGASLISSGRDTYAASCTPPSGPCQADIYGFKTAIFTVDGFGIVAGWSHESYIKYWAWPQSGHAVQLYSISHRHKMNAPWPQGTWQVNKLWTWLNGTRVDWHVIPTPCASTPCYIYGLGMGANLWSGQFHYYNDTLYGSDAYCDGLCRLRVSAGIYPAGGASYASNHTASDTCRKPTHTGTQYC